MSRVPWPAIQDRQPRPDLQGAQSLLHRFVGKQKNHDVDEPKRGGTVTAIQKDRARHYREFAAEIRASADAMKHEEARQAMLQAATVWDQLDDFV